MQKIDYHCLSYIVVCLFLVAQESPNITKQRINSL